MPEVHGGRLVAQALRRHGVQHVFTLCGAHIQAIYDGCQDEGIRVVDTRHEHTAVSAAAGVGRITGKAGVAIVAAGPGVTNSVTALASAAKAQVPLVCIGGAGPQSLRHMGSLQDLDGVSLMQPLAKWAARVSDPTRLMEYVDVAFNRAQSGIPGPVYLELPLDVLMSLGEPTLPHTAPLPLRRPGPPRSEIKNLAELLKCAGKPVFLIGSQLSCSPRSDILGHFADNITVPIYLNGAARGSLAPSHEALLAQTRRSAMRQADLIVLMGTAFDFRVGYGTSSDWNPHAKVVHVNLDDQELGHNRAVDLAMQADIGLTLEALLEEVGSKSCPEWLDSLIDEEGDLEDARAANAPAEDSLSAHAIYAEVSQRLGPNDLVVADGGDFVSGAVNTLFLEAPQMWLDAGPLGTLGMGPGFAMAGALCRPTAKTVALFGDGAFGFHAMEFEAMARQKLPVVAIVGNNGGYSQVRRGQVQLYGAERAVATELSFARYDQVVQSLGGEGFWVTQASELAPALDAAFASDLPSCVNVELRAG